MPALREPPETSRATEKSISSVNYIRISMYISLTSALDNLNISGRKRKPLTALYGYFAYVLVLSSCVLDLIISACMLIYDFYLYLLVYISIDKHDIFMYNYE